jgi:hypothetical protein
MSRGYRIRVAVWLLLSLVLVWVTAGWLSRLGTDPDQRPGSQHPAAVPGDPTGPADGTNGRHRRQTSPEVLPYLSRYVNRPVAFLGENWLFVFELVFVGGLASGSLGRGLGVHDLVYADSRRVRFVNGLVGGLYVGDLLLVLYLTTGEPVPWPVGVSPTLFPVSGDGVRSGEAEAVRRAGNFLLVTWPAVLAAIYVPGVVRYYREQDDARFPAFGVGLAASIPLGVGAALAAWGAADWAGGLIDDWRALYARMPAAVAGKVGPDDHPLHLFATAVTTVPLIGLGAAGAASLLGRVACPVWVVCLMLWLFNSKYAFVAFHFNGLQYVLLALGVASLLTNIRHPYKLSLPNLGPEYAAARAGRPVPLFRPPPAAPPVPLLRADDLLARFCESWQREHGTGTRPRLVVVAAAGGGARSAVWTAAVLEDLERRAGPRFGRHVRLITGSSGGMMAAGLYAAARVRPLGHGSLARAVGEDSLWPTIQTMVTRDLEAAFLPFYRDWDRGRSLEAAWHRNTPPLRPGDRSPFQTTFAELLDAEREGLAPSLIFSPTLVEDGRRLLISNLDLGDLAAESVPTLATGPDGRTVVKWAEVSRSAVEFFRLFPASHGRFEVGTAARLSNTFPYVTPGVSLPADPPRRVVDAGYFDNYGIDLACRWLHRHQEAVRRYCSGVAVVEVRGFPLEAEKLHAGGSAEEREGEGRAGVVVDVMAEVSTPAEALVNVRSASAYYRNDQLLGILGAEFNTRRSDPFLVRALVECPRPTSLSWSLPARERKRIFQLLSESGAVPVRQVAGWFGSGGC